MFFNVVTTTMRGVFSLAMNKSLHATLIKNCTSRGELLSLSPLLKHITHRLTVLKSTLHKHSASTAEVNECNFFHKVEFNDTALLHTHFHVRCHFVRLLLCGNLSHGKKNVILAERYLLLYQQHPPLKSLNHGII